MTTCDLTPGALPDPWCPSTTKHGTLSAYTDHRCRCTAARFIASKDALRRQLRRAEHGPLLVPMRGTQRRVQALMAAGWPASEIAARLGHGNSQDVTAWARGARGHVLLRNAEKVRAIYAELEFTDGPSVRTRTRCQAKGWYPPEFWFGQDLDMAAVWPRSPAPVEVDEVAVYRLVNDPGFFAADARRAEVVEAVRVMLGQQRITLADAAERLGLKRKAVVHLWEKARNVRA